MATLREALTKAPKEAFTLEDFYIRPIRDDEDLWYATVQCRLKPGQEEFVNPAGFMRASDLSGWTKPTAMIGCLGLCEKV